jgi:osmoprotectant transport system ATP-binding protein
MIELANVSKSYGSTRVLEPINLSIERGRTTVLIGPSGCGKSTLLRIMVGLETVDSGRVSFDEIELTSGNAAEMRRQMGYVLQDGGLFPHLTARENVTLLARYLRQSSPKQLNARVTELADLNRVPCQILDRYPAQLSGGQRQRVAIMRALMLDPKVVFFDEPMGALDPLIRFELQEDLRQIFLALGKTVVLVTHDMGEAGFFGDPIILLNNGCIVQRGPLRELLDSPADPFVTRFINAQRGPL